ncbi:MAG: hypothetical protein ABI402_07435 [Ferruginibacter sp.]
MKTTIASFLLLICLAGCDPTFFGKTVINNETDVLLNVIYQTENKDSSLIIEPNSYTEIYHIGGLGSGKDYDCCNCEFLSITLKPTDTSKHLIKDISLSDNWNMTNENHHRFSSHEITCEFIVRPSDIQ